MGSNFECWIFEICLISSHKSSDFDLGYKNGNTMFTSSPNALWTFCVVFSMDEFAGALGFICDQ